MDRFYSEALRVAPRNHVQLHRDCSLLVTDLLPVDMARRKDVLLLYQGTTKDEYRSPVAEWDDLGAISVQDGPKGPWL